jgi:septum formation protein
VLASSSPRRRELLSRLGLPFEVIPSDVAEDQDKTLAPVELAVGLATDKARSVAARLKDGLVIGADTIVVLDGEIMGKPKDEEEAFSMLSRLSGARHSVITGIAIVDIDNGKEHKDAEITQVSMHPISEGRIRDYISRRKPFDKAGAYAVQETSDSFISKVEGSYTNVMGLPMEKLKEMLTMVGVEV